MLGRNSSTTVMNSKQCSLLLHKQIQSQIICLQQQISLFSTSTTTTTTSATTTATTTGSPNTSVTTNRASRGKSKKEKEKEKEKKKEKENDEILRDVLNEHKEFRTSLKRSTIRPNENYLSNSKLRNEKQPFSIRNIKEQMGVDSLSISKNDLHEIFLQKLNKTKQHQQPTHENTKTSTITAETTTTTENTQVNILNEQKQQQQHLKMLANNVDETRSTEAIEYLYRILNHNDLPSSMGTVAFIGMDGSDKSTIIDGLIGFELLGRKSRWRTISIQCIRTRGESYFEFVDGGWGNSGRIYDVEVLKRKIDEKMHGWSPREMVSEVPLEIIVAAPHLHNIRFIDFPSFRVTTDYKDTVNLIKNTITSVMASVPYEQQIIALCMEPVSAPSGDDSQIARSVDPLWSSTFGVMTKLDKFFLSPENATELLSNRKIELDHGWVGYRGKKETEIGLPLDLNTLNQQVKKEIQTLYNCTITSGPKDMWNKIFKIYIKKNKEYLLNLIQNSIRQLHKRTLNVLSMASDNTLVSINGKVNSSLFFRTLTHPNSVESIAMNTYIKKNLENEIYKVLEEAMIEQFKMKDQSPQPLKRYNEAEYIKHFEELTNYLSHPIPIKISNTHHGPIDYTHYGQEWLQLIKSPGITSESAFFDHLHHQAAQLKSSYQIWSESQELTSVHSSSNSSKDTSASKKGISIEKERQSEFERWNANYRKVIHRLIKRKWFKQAPRIVSQNMNRYFAMGNNKTSSIERFFINENSQQISSTIDTNIFMHQIYKEQTPSITYEEFRVVLKDILPNNKDQKKLIPFSNEWTTIYFRAVAIRVANDIYRCALHNLVIPNIIQTNHSLLKFSEESIRSQLVSLENIVIPKEDAIENIKVICGFDQLKSESLLPKISDAISVCDKGDQHSSSE